MEQPIFNFDEWIRKISVTDESKRQLIINFLVENDCNTRDALVEMTESHFPTTWTIGMKNSVLHMIKILQQSEGLKFLI